jgi:hypothetical protein
MVFRFLLKGIVLISLFSISCFTLQGQNKEFPLDKKFIEIQEKAQKALDEKNIGDYIRLAGIIGTLDCLEPAYCQNEGVQTWYPNAGWTPLPGVVGYEWEIKYAGSVLGGLVDVVGSGLTAQFYFYPERLDASYLSKTLEVYIYQVTGTGFRVTSIADLTTVLPAPTLFTVSGPAEICQGSTAQIVLSGSQLNVRYSLYNGASYVSLQDGTGDPLSFTVNQTGSYRIVAETVPGGCTNDMTGIADLLVNPLPVVTVGSNSPICAGQALNLTATGGTSYAWSGPGGYVSAVQNPTRANATPAMSGTYTVTVTDAKTCQNSANTAVTVNARPTAVVSGSTTICNGGSATVTITLTGTQPFSFTYTDGTTPTTVNNHNGLTYTFNASPATTTTYTVTSLTDNNTCGALAGDITGSAVITVNPRPTSVLSGGGVTTCNGTPVNLTVTLTGTAPWNITYTDGIGSFNATANSSPYTLSVNPSTTSTYTITGLSDALGCPVIGADMTGSALVTVNPRPTSTLSIVGPDELCNGGSTTIRFALTGTGPWNLTYTVNGVATNVPGIAVSPYEVVVSPSATTTYVATALTDANCTSIPADRNGTALVTVYPRPTAVISGTTTICNGASTNVSVSFTGLGPWDLGYTVNGTPVSVLGIATNPYVISVNPSANTTYLLTSLMDGNGCSALPGDLTGSAVVTVNPRPTAVLSGGATVCNGGNAAISLTLTGTGPWNISLAANGTPLPVITTSTNPYNFNVSPSVTTNYTLVGLTDSRCTALAGDLRVPLR